MGLTPVARSRSARSALVSLRRGMMSSGQATEVGDGECAVLSRRYDALGLGIGGVLVIFTDGRQC